MKKTFISIIMGAALAVPSVWADPAGSEPGETWTSLGTGLFTENALHAFYAISTYPEVEVEIQESNLHPGRYRLVNPYANFPADIIGSPGCYEGDWYIYINASDPEHVYVETSRTGFQAGVGQELVVGSIADDYYNNRYGDWILADKEGVCGKFVDGRITFPSNALLATLFEYGSGWDDDIIWKVCDPYGKFSVKFPGAPDLEIAISKSTIDSAHEYLHFNVTLGKSVEYALVALVEGNYTQEVYNGITNGTIPSVRITASGDVAVPYTGDGAYTLVVVPYLEGTPRTAGFKSMEIAEDESEWRKAGQALYREAFLASNEYFNHKLVQIDWNEAEYYVDVEESVSRPGYIRLVDAYGPTYPYSIGYYFNDTRKWYIYIDATNPDKVIIEQNADGVGLDLNFGAMNMTCKAARYLIDPWNWTDEQVAAKGLYGTFANDEITFAPNALSINFSAAPMNWYEANQNGNFRIKFQPGQINGTQSGISATDIDYTNVPEEYYTIDGMRINGDNLSSGIYIVRQGNNVKKILK